MSFSTTIWQPPEMISGPTWGLGPLGCECSFLSSVYTTDAAAKQGVSNTLLLSLSLSLLLILWISCLANDFGFHIWKYFKFKLFRIILRLALNSYL